MVGSPARTARAWRSTPGRRMPPSSRSRSRPGRKSALSSSAAQSTGPHTPIGRPLSDISPDKLMFTCERPPILRGLFHYSRMKSAPQKPCSGNNFMPECSKIRGVIRRYSGLSKLRKPISAFLYSRLLTWANTSEKGLNPPRSFNLVSPARKRPSGDPNCELFLQGLIIPVPPSTPLYRPVGTEGNNWFVFPGRNAKRKPSDQRVRGLLFPLFRWWLCPAAMPKQYQTVLGSTKTRVQKPVLATPTRQIQVYEEVFLLNLQVKYSQIC